MSNILRDAFEGVIQGPKREWEQLGSHMDKNKQRLFQLNRQKTSLKERTDAWFDFDKFPPFQACVERGTAIYKRLVEGQRLNFSDLNLINFLMEEGMTQLSAEPGSNNDKPFREERLVDTSRVIETEMFEGGNRPTDQTSWDAHFAQIMNFFNPADIITRKNHYPEARFLRTFMFGYLLSWKSPDPDEYFINTNPNITQYYGLVNWFKKLESPERQEIWKQLGTFEEKTGIEVRGTLHSGIAPLGSGVEDHKIVRELRDSDR